MMLEYDRRMDDHSRVKIPQILIDSGYVLPNQIRYLAFRSPGRLALCTDTQYAGLLSRELAHIRDPDDFEHTDRIMSARSSEASVDSRNRVLIPECLIREFDGKDVKFLIEDGLVEIWDPKRYDDFLQQSRGSWRMSKRGKA